MTSIHVVDQVLSAASLEDLREDDEDIQSVFIRLQKRVHPDRFLAESDKKKAHQAFVKLSTLLTPKASAMSKITSRKRAYILGNHFPQSVYEVYDVEYDAGHKNARMFVTKDPKNNQEAVSFSRTLKTIRSGLDDKYLGFIPELIDSFNYASPSGTRSIVVTNTHEGFVPLYRVLERHPDGISGRNVAWIFRRILFILGGIHDSGYSHGKVALDSFLVHAPGHGLIVTDWGRSSDSLDNREKDIADASIVAETLLSVGSPKQLTAFFKGCRLTSVPTAHELLAEFDDLLQRIYGPPKFTELTL